MATCQSPPLILISSYLVYFLGVKQPSPLLRIPELYSLPIARTWQQFGIGMKRTRETEILLVLPLTSQSTGNHGGREEPF